MLEAGARYTATLTGGSGGVKDSAGNPLAADKAWTFTVATGSPVAQDSFTRTASAGWGAAETGGIWSILRGAASNFAVDGSRGTISTPKGTVEQAAHLASVSTRDVDARVEVRFPATVKGSRNVYAFLLLRSQAGAGHYRIGLALTPGGKSLVRGQTDTGTSLFPDADTGLGFSAGVPYVLRVQVQGASPTTIRARAWKAAAAEPAGWLVTASDNTAPLQSAGAVGIRTLNDSSTAMRLEFDDLLATPLP